jgi:hypothetical protein
MNFRRMLYFSYHFAFSTTLLQAILRCYRSFDDDLVLNVKSFDDVVAYFEKSCGVTSIAELQLELPKIISELRPLEPKTYIRGKYELWFFVKFIDKLIEILRTLSRSLGFSFKNRTSIGEENAMEVLGPRLPIPQSLHNFLVVNGIMPNIHST